MSKSIIDVSAANVAVSEFEDLDDFPLTTVLADRWSLKKGGAPGLWVITLGDLLRGLERKFFTPFVFNRGLGDQFSLPLLKSMESDFFARAFGQITGAVFKNSDGFHLRLADGHNRCEGLRRAFESGSLTDSDLKFPVSFCVVPATEFQSVYSTLNTNRSHNTGEKCSNPLLRYGDAILKMAIHGGINAIDKTQTIQLAYLIEHMESGKPITGATLYADVFGVRTAVGPKSSDSATVNPVGLPQAKRAKIISAMQWLEAVRNHVDRNSGAIPLRRKAFRGLLLLWHVRGERCLDTRSAKRFATKLNKKASILHNQIPQITSGDYEQRAAAEARIQKTLK